MVVPKKGTVLVLYLPGNGLHSNVLQWNELYDQQMGLNELGKSGVKVTVSHQGIDYEIFPFLRKVHEQYPNIEVLNAPRGHALIPELSDTLQKWETEKKCADSDVTFFGEFYIPQSNRIPTAFTLVLSDHTHLYSLYTPQFLIEVADGIVDVDAAPFPEGATAIKIGNKVGIIMQHELYNPILKQFQLFQRAPYEIDANANGLTRIQVLIKLFKEAIALPGRNKIIIPIDLEAPWVGSAYGAEIWTILTSAINDAGLAQYFVHLKDLLDEYRDEAVATPHHPERKLAKWKVYKKQGDYLREIDALSIRTRREKELMTIAAGSDLLSAWERKISELNGSVIRLSGRNRKGEEIKLPISYSQDVINIQSAALAAVLGEKTFEQILEGLYQHSFKEKDGESFLLRQFLAYAKRMGI